MAQMDFSMRIVACRYCLRRAIRWKPSQSLFPEIGFEPTEGSPSLCRSRKRCRAVDAGGEFHRRIGQHQAHAEGIAGGVEHLVDDRDGRGKHAACRLTGSNIRFHSLLDEGKGGDGHVDFDKQWIDLRDLEDLGLLVDVLTWSH